MYGVGGREREGKPPKLWSNFGHDLKTPATGAVDLIATRIPPGPGPITFTVLTTKGLIKTCPMQLDFFYFK